MPGLLVLAYVWAERANTAMRARFWFPASANFFSLRIGLGVEAVLVQARVGILYQVDFNSLRWGFSEAHSQ